MFCGIPVRNLPVSLALGQSPSVGTAELRAGSGTLKVAKGESCYLSAADAAVTASGPATLFIADSGIDA